MTQKIRNLCLYGIIYVWTHYHIFNYIVSYKMLNDATLQWRVAFYAYSIMFFLFSLRLFLGTPKRWNVKYIFSGWLLLFSSIDMIGVFLGWNMHSKAPMALLFTLILFLIALLLVELWVYYLVPQLKNF